MRLIGGVADMPTVKVCSASCGRARPRFISSGRRFISSRQHQKIPLGKPDGTAHGLRGRITHASVSIDSRACGRRGCDNSASLYKRMGGVHIATVGALWAANFSHAQNARKRNGGAKFA